MNTKEFYDKNQFPGHYTMESLNVYKDDIVNPYIQFIDEAIKDSETVLDLGCGSGLIVNFLASKYPNKKFVAVDFADGILFAQDFAKKNNINNITFIREDILKFKSQKQFDVVICQGVLHHIVDDESAYIVLRDNLKMGGKLLLGLYHPLGKILKKFFKINYKSKVLEDDQEINPYETSYTISRVKQLTINNFRIVQIYPKNLLLTIITDFVQFNRSGGIIVYNLIKTK